MSTYLESVCLLPDDELREECRRQLVRVRTLHGREKAVAYDRLLQLDQFLKTCGKSHLYLEAAAAYEAERDRLRAANAAGRASGLRGAD